MTVRLTKPVRIAADGYHSEECFAGQVLDLPPQLAEGLIRDSLAEPFEAAIEPVIETLPAEQADPVGAEPVAEQPQVASLEPVEPAAEPKTPVRAAIRKREYQ